MVNPVTLDDLAARWHPNPLDDDEAASNAQVVLDDAWEALLDEVPGLEDRLIAGTVRLTAVKRAVTSAALRVLRNPENYTDGSESIDDWASSWKRDPASVSNDLYFTAAELRRLGGRYSEAFTIRPGPAA